MCIGTWAAAYGRGATNDSTVQTAVALDGADPEVYETSPTSANIELFNTGNIAQQEHSLVMSSIANSHISIDYFVVRSEPPKGQAAAVEADTEEKKGGVSGGIIAAAVVGGILLIIIIGVRYWFWRRKKRTPASREFTKSVPTLTPKPCTSSNQYRLIFPALINYNYIYSYQQPPYISPNWNRGIVTIERWTRVRPGYEPDAQSKFGYRVRIRI